MQGNKKPAEAGLLLILMGQANSVATIACLPVPRPSRPVRVAAVRIAAQAWFGSADRCSRSTCTYSWHIGQRSCLDVSGFERTAP